jgi:hypothetical protein
MTPAAQQFLSRLAEMDPEDMVDLRFGYKAKLTQTSSFKASVAQEAIDYYRTPVNTTGAGKAFERPREYCYSPCAVCDSGSDAHVEPKQGVNYPSRTDGSAYILRPERDHQLITTPHSPSHKMSQQKRRSDQEPKSDLGIDALDALLGEDSDVVIRELSRNLNQHTKGGLVANQLTLALVRRMERRITGLEKMVLNQKDAIAELRRG